MKRPLQYLVIATLFLSTIFPVLAQTNDGKIPFQGVLYEAGEPVTATKQMIFSIAAVSWTETHSVSVVNGLYSVVLGEITPFPANLFETSNTASLGINVAGSALPPVEIHAPYLDKALVKKNMPDQIEFGTEALDWYSRLNGGLMEFKSLSGNSLMNYWALGSQHTDKVASQITLRSDESTNIRLSAKTWEPNGINLPYIGLSGSGNTGGIWMDVSQDTNTSREWGTMTLDSNDGASTAINADGINLNGPNGESFGIDYNGFTSSVYNTDFSTDGYTSGISGGSMNFKSTTGNSLMTYWATGSQHTNKVASQITLSSDESTNIELSSKNWIPNGINLPYIALKGDTKQNDGWGEYTVERIWMEVNQDTNTNSEWGQINLTSKDGNSASIDGTGSVYASQNIIAGDANDNGVVLNKDFPQIQIFSGGDGSDNGIETINLNGDNGNITVTGLVFAGGLQLTSDIRLKKDIKNLDNPLRNVQNLRGVSYTWKDKKKSQANQIGLIAQEVEKIYPEFVHTNEDGMKSVNYAQMTAVLIEAVKELSAKVTNLEDENSDLKASMEKLSRLESKINLLEKLLISKPVDASTTTAQK